MYRAVSIDDLHRVGAKTPSALPQVDALPASMTMALDLGPRDRAGVVRPPDSWGPNPQGLEAGIVSARVWRPDTLNGVTLVAE